MMGLVQPPPGKLFPTIPETNMLHPETQWLEDDPFASIWWWDGFFSEVNS